MNRDYECPECGRLLTTIAELRAECEGNRRLVFATTHVLEFIRMPSKQPVHRAALGNARSPVRKSEGAHY